MTKDICNATVSANLRRGKLSVWVSRSDTKADDLFAIAERRNPKRAFLFVSKVLGRHIPVAPAVMRDNFEKLAAKIPSDLPGPVLVIGLAETAVGLGAGVHRAYSQARPDAMYIVSTRHPVGTELFTRFEEEHSHASAHLVHLPIEPDLRRMMLSARSLVLVDDEMSTGRTFINLIQSLMDAGLNSVERIVALTLTDWSQGEIQSKFGSRAQTFALLEGRFTFEEDVDAALPVMPSVDQMGSGASPLVVSRDWGRLGVRRHPDTIAPDLTVLPGARVLVIGTGEYVWRPFLLAERLEHQRAEVHFCATSRSPIALGHAIGNALSFNDNYGLGIPNFLYNVHPERYDRIFVCCETQHDSIDPRLMAALQAEAIADEL